MSNNQFIPYRVRTTSNHQKPMPIISKSQNFKFTNMTNTFQENHQSDLQILCNRIQQLQKKVSELEGQLRYKAKRTRRRAEQIEKKHTCQLCSRRYGSLVSLNLHNKIKHRVSNQKNKEIGDKLNQDGKKNIQEVSKVQKICNEI